MTTIAERIAQWLEEKGITHAFGIIGGGNVALWDAIHRRGRTALICCHHEQAATMASAYFNRVLGRIGSIALVTTGAGSANAITGVLAAHMDGIPLLVLSGNEASRYMYAPTRVWGVQGYDSSGVGHMVAKQGVRWQAVGKGARGLDFEHDLAMRAPQGPVWVDFPKDVQHAIV